MVCPGSASRAGTAWLPPATSASRPCAAMPNSPAANWSANRFLRRPEAALDTLPGPRLRGPSAGSSSRRRGGGDLRGSEGARPPASLRRGRTECGHGGLPTICQRFLKRGCNPASRGDIRLHFPPPGV